MKKQKCLTALLAGAAFLASAAGLVSCGNPSASPSKPVTAIQSVTNNKIYFVGDTVSNSDFTVKIKNNKTVKTLLEDEFTVEVPEENLDENQKLIQSAAAVEHEEEVVVKVNYNSLSKNKIIKVREIPSKIKVTPASGFITEYYVGEEIDISKLTVTAFYGDADIEGEDITALVEVKGNPTANEGDAELVVTYAGLESEPIAVTVIPYDGGLVTEATATGSNTDADGVTGNLYRGFKFTNGDAYVEDQWAVQTTIETDADFEAGKYYKVSFTLGSTVGAQSTIVNITANGEPFFSKAFTTNATDNVLELYVSPTEAVENVGIAIGHGWCPPSQTFTIKNLKIVEQDISSATEMTLIASEESFGSTASVNFTATVMNYFVQPEYSVTAETGSTGSKVKEDGTFVFGTFNENAKSSDVTVKAVFNNIEVEKTVTVKLLTAFSEADYTWGDDVTVGTDWVYESSKGNIGMYSSIGAEGRFSSDGTAAVFTNTNPGKVWTSEWNSQIVIGAFDVSAGDTYTVSFKAFFASTDGNISDGGTSLIPSFTDVKEYSKDIVAVPNQYKGNKAEACIGFGMGYAGVTNSVTIYDVQVTKKSSYEVTGITVTPAATENLTLKKGKTKQFSAKDTGLNVDRTVTWSVSPSTAGTISSTGLFTAGEVSEDTLVTITATYSDTISATSQITVLAASEAAAPYNVAIENIAGAGAEFVFTWEDDAYALPLSTDAIVTFRLGTCEKETQPWARAEGTGLRAYMSTVGAAWSDVGEKEIYIRVKSTANKMYDITAILDVTEDAETKTKSGSISEIEVKIVENIIPSVNKVSFESADAEAIEVTMTAEGCTPDSYSAESSSTEVATVSVDANVITITPVADGDAVITVTAGTLTSEIKVHVGAAQNLVTGLSVYNYLDAAGSTAGIVSINENNVTIEKPATSGWGHPWSSQLFLELAGTDGVLIESGKSYTLKFTVTSTIDIGAGCVVKIAEKNPSTQKDGTAISDAASYAYPANTPVEVTIDFTAAKTVADPIVVMALGDCGASTISISDVVLTAN